MTEHLFVGMPVSVLIGRDRLAGKIVRIDGERVLVRRELRNPSIDPDVYVHEDDVMPMTGRNLGKW